MKDVLKMVFSNFPTWFNTLSSRLVQVLVCVAVALGIVCIVHKVEGLLDKAIAAIERILNKAIAAIERILNKAIGKYDIFEINPRKFKFKFATHKPNIQQINIDE